MQSLIKKQVQILFCISAIIIFSSLSAVSSAQSAEPLHLTAARIVDPAGIDLHIITDEADCVLAILKKRSLNQTISDSDWQSLFSSEGYTRLKKRESSMKRSFTDDEFKAFVLSDTLLLKEQSLSKTLSLWKEADLYAMAKRALNYLPEGAKIKAKIYPVIKPRTNSFVFEMDKDPAIFLFIDPVKTKEKFENTVTHELHHIGYFSSCESSEEAADSMLAENVRSVFEWIGGFGEGFAMLAAAGGPDIDPHYCSSKEERARWDKDVANFNNDLNELEKFFSGILDKKLTKDEIYEKGFSFLGIQGPWYTVGWKMAVVIEKTFGHEKLIRCICNHKELLPAYNEAVNDYNRQTGEHLAQWPPSLLERIK